jgi:hypothetical protein
MCENIVFPLRAGRTTRGRPALPCETNVAASARARKWPSILPDRQLTYAFRRWTSPAPSSKYSCFQATPTLFMSLASLPAQRGVGHCHERWDGLRWTRQRCARDGIAGWVSVSGQQRASGIPCAFYFEWGRYSQTSGASRRGNATTCPPSLAMTAFGCLKTGSNNKYRHRPGLEPGPITPNVDVALSGPLSLLFKSTAAAYGSRPSPGRRTRVLTHNPAGSATASIERSGAPAIVASNARKRL